MTEFAYEESFKPGRLPDKYNAEEVNRWMIIIVPPQHGQRKRRETIGADAVLSCGWTPASMRQIGSSRARVRRDRKPKNRMRTNPRGST